MSFKLEEKGNKKIVGIFPGVIEEVKNNIRDISGANARAIAPNEDEQKAINANKKYIKCMTNVLGFGEEALNILQNCNCDITDASAILFILKGFSVYANNRINELDRSRKNITGERFFYCDDEQIVSMTSPSIGNNGEEVEDLSYNYNRLYSRKDLAKDTKEAVVCNDKTVEWVSEIMKTNKTKNLPKRERDRFFDIVLNVKLTNNANSMINSLLKLSSDKEEFKICQNLLINYNSFVKRAYMECWAFKVDNNL